VRSSTAQQMKLAMLDMIYALWFESARAHSQLACLVCVKQEPEEQEMLAGWLAGWLAALGKLWLVYDLLYDFSKCTLMATP
jgi:hypothetical protein